MSYNDDKIKLDSSQRDLNEKFKNEIKDTEEKIYWYIKFTLPLSPESVSKKTMQVTDTKGFIFKTNIIYNKQLELIVIEALEPYKEDEYYILHISKAVKAENLKNLKRDVNILFKIKGGVVAEFKELAENVKVPKPRKKPSFNQKPTKFKVYSFEKDSEKLLGDKLSYANIKFNPLIAILGVPLFLIGIFLKNQILIALGGVTAFLGFFHIVKQVINREFRSTLNYNIGAISFNKSKYKKAKRNFEKALILNPNNEYAEYASNKVSFYL